MRELSYCPLHHLLRSRPSSSWTSWSLKGLKFKLTLVLGGRLSLLAEILVFDEGSISLLLFVEALLVLESHLLVLLALGGLTLLPQPCHGLRIKIVNLQS